MGRLDRWRRRASAALSLPQQPAGAAAATGPGTTAGDAPAPAATGVDPVEEARLWEVLREDPNDVEAFARLAEIVRRGAVEGHPSHEQPQAADDAVWSLAEELAHSGKAWYPLVELARLSVHDDREAAMRRLGTAAERDPRGQALATGLAMLRDAGMPDEALNLGMGHWRPREHDLEAGRQLVEAAVEAGRTNEARRHLEALSLHPDAQRVEALQRELSRRIPRDATPARGIAQQRPTPTPARGLSLPNTGSIDLRIAEANAKEAAERAARAAAAAPATTGTGASGPSTATLPESDKDEGPEQQQRGLWGRRRR